jgi:hypothetical protein
MSTTNSTPEMPETAECDCDEKRRDDVMKAVSVFVSTALLSWGNTARLLFLAAMLSAVCLLTLWVVSALGETAAVAQLLAGAGFGGTVTAIASHRRER